MTEQSVDRQATTPASGSAGSRWSRLSTRRIRSKAAGSLPVFSSCSGGSSFSYVARDIALRRSFAIGPGDLDAQATQSADDGKISGRWRQRLYMASRLAVPPAASV